MLPLLLLHVATASPASVPQARAEISAHHKELSALLERPCMRTTAPHAVRSCGDALVSYQQRMSDVRAALFSRAHARWGPLNVLRRQRMLHLHDRAQQLQTRAKRALQELQLPRGDVWAGRRTRYEMVKVDASHLGEDRSPGRLYIGRHEVPAGLWLEVTKRAATEPCGQRWLDAEQAHTPATCISTDRAVAFANRMSQLDGLDPVYVRRGGQLAVDESALGYRLPTAQEWRTFLPSTCASGPTDARLHRDHSINELMLSPTSQSWQPTTSNDGPRCAGEPLHGSERHARLGVRMVLVVPE